MNLHNEDAVNLPLCVIAVKIKQFQVNSMSGFILGDVYYFVL